MVQSNIKVIRITNRFMPWIRVFTFGAIGICAASFLLCAVDIAELQQHVDRFGCAAVILAATAEFFIALMAREQQLVLDEIDGGERDSIIAQSKAVAITTFNGTTGPVHVALLQGTFFWGFGANLTGGLTFLAIYCVAIGFLAYKLATHTQIEDVDPWK